MRLVRSRAHLRSLALSAKIGFEVPEPPVLMQGNLPPPEPWAARVRRAAQGDVPACPTPWRKGPRR